MSSADGLLDDLSEKHVLLVEDDQVNAVLTCTMLGLLGIRHVFHCPDGRDVDSTLARMPRLDLVLLDLRLPGESGYQILARLRQRDALRNIPIVAITADVTTDDVARAEAAGFDGFLAKPFNFDRFPGNLRRLLSGQSVWDIR